MNVFALSLQSQYATMDKIMSAHQTNHHQYEKPIQSKSIQHLNHYQPYHTYKTRPSSVFQQQRLQRFKVIINKILYMKYIEDEAIYHNGTVSSKSARRCWFVSNSVYIYRCIYIFTINR